MGVARDRQDPLRVEPKNLPSNLWKNGRRSGADVAEARFDLRRAVRLQADARGRMEARLTLAAVGHAAADSPMIIPGATLGPCPPAEATRSFFIRLTQFLR